MPHADVIRKAKAGDTQAFELIVEEYAPELRRFACRYLDVRDVDDVLQDVWTSVWRKLWQLDDERRFVPWLRTIALRTCLNHRKARAAKRRSEFSLAPEHWSLVESFVADEDTPVHEVLEDRDLRRLVSELLDRLPGDYGTLLRLRYMAEMSYKEIAEIANIPPAPVKQRLHQGREILRARLARTVKESWPRLKAHRNEGGKRV